MYVCIIWTSLNYFKTPLVVKFVFCCILEGMRRLSIPIQGLFHEPRKQMIGLYNRNRNINKKKINKYILQYQR